MCPEPRWGSENVLVFRKGKKCRFKPQNGKFDTDTEKTFRKGKGDHLSQSKMNMNFHARPHFLLIGPLSWQIK
jgi:hypothetical protein